MSAVPIGPFVRFALIVATTAYSNWDTISAQFDRHVENPTSPIFGYYVQHIWQMKDQSGTFSDKERAMCGVHWINTTGGDPDYTWTSADYALIESGFQTLFTSLAGNMSTDHKLVEHRWYAFGPGVFPPNPPSRITTIASPIAGSGTQIWPHQAAETLTFRTPLRKHWGRIYLPLGTTGMGNPGGQYAQAVVDSFAAAGSTYLKSGTANGLTPVVWDRLRKSALGVTAIEADSVPDIIRRRRPRQAFYKKILTT